MKTKFNFSKKSAAAERKHPAWFKALLLEAEADIAKEYQVTRDEAKAFLFGTSEQIISNFLTSWLRHKKIDATSISMEQYNLPFFGVEIDELSPGVVEYKLKFED